MRQSLHLFKSEAGRNISVCLVVRCCGASAPRAVREAAGGPPDGRGGVFLLKYTRNFGCVVRIKYKNYFVEHVRLTRSFYHIVDVEPAGLE